MPTDQRTLTQRAFASARTRVGSRTKQAIRRVAGRPLVAWERRSLHPVLSVVIPVYNVEAYVREALDSVLTQSLHNLEVIVVDDGSTDGSLAVLREFERRDARVRVFTQVNSGQGIARNLGVEHAQGEFLTFVDADDVIPPGSFEHMVDTLRRTGSDFCVGNLRRLRHRQYMSIGWQRTVHRSEHLGTTLEEYPAAMLHIIAHNRVFRTAFWRDKVGGYRGHIAYEDHVPMLMAYVRATKFDILNRITYNWRVREDQTSTSQQKANIENLLDRIAVKEEANDLLLAEATDPVYDAWVARVIDIDFVPFVAEALDADDAYRNMLTAAYRTFCDRATERAWDLVRVFPKVRGWLVAQGRWADVDAATRYFLSVHHVPATRVVDGRLVADLPADRPCFADLPEHLLVMSPYDAHFEGALQKVGWHADGVEITGWMRLRSATVPEDRRITLELRSDAGTLALEAEPLRIPEANLWAQLPYSGCEYGGFRVTVPYADVAAGHTWYLHGRLEADGLVSEGIFTYRPPNTSAHDPGRSAEVAARWDGALGFVLERTAARPVDAPHGAVVVHAIEAAPDEIRIRVTGDDTAALDRARLGNARLQLTLLDVKADGGEHLLRFDTRVSEFGGPLHLVPGGELHLTVDGHTAKASRAFRGTLPLRVDGGRYHVEATPGSAGTVQLAVVPPRRADELGRYHGFRLQDGYRRSTEPLRDAVLLVSYQGEFCTDSQLAIDRHLAGHRPDIERIWGVSDHGTVLPEGARGVVLGSTEFYEAAATSRWLSKNTDFGPWMRVKEGQAYLQTFHGYPFKSMGIDFWRSKAYTRMQVRHEVAKANEEWDLILVPSPECERYYRESYDYGGAVIASGYPRTDALVNSDAAQVRSDVLRRLGVPEDKTVVLYAPTFRDYLTTRVFAAQRFDELDLEALTRALGPSYVVLLRGHNNNQREADRVHLPGVVDVTDYPDINELTLAADVAVLDYSSLRFDWAITGKPIVFFVPDLDTYFGQRAPLFPFAESAPGPWVGTTAEVAAQLADVPGLAHRYADPIASFNARFNTLHDGHATERVLETFLDASRPWRQA